MSFPDRALDKEDLRGGLRALMEDQCHGGLQFPGVSGPLGDASASPACCLTVVLVGEGLAFC